MMFKHTYTWDFFLSPPQHLITWFFTNLGNNNAMTDSYATIMAKKREECRPQLESWMKKYPTLDEKDVEQWSDAQISDLSRFLIACFMYWILAEDKSPVKWIQQSSNAVSAVSERRERQAWEKKQQEQEAAWGVRFIPADKRAKEYNERLACEAKADKINKQRYDEDQMRALSDWMNKTEWEVESDRYACYLTLWDVPSGLRQRLWDLNYNVRFEEIKNTKVIYKTTTQPPEHTKDVTQTKKGWNINLCGTMTRMTIAVKGFPLN